MNNKKPKYKLGFFIVLVLLIISLVAAGGLTFLFVEQKMFNQQLMWLTSSTCKLYQTGSWSASSGYSSSYQIPLCKEYENLKSSCKSVSEYNSLVQKYNQLNSQCQKLSTECQLVYSQLQTCFATTGQSTSGINLTQLIQLISLFT